MTIDYFFAMAGAVTLGWIEQHNHKQGAYAGNRLIFGIFAWPYHVALLLAFICLAGKHQQLLPLLAIIEDFSFFTFYKEEKLSPDDWINMSLGGFYLFGQWIPTVYLLGFLFYALLEYFL